MLGSYRVPESKIVLESYNSHLEAFLFLLPTGGEEKEALGVGSICVAILPSLQDIKYIAL